MIGSVTMTIGFEFDRWESLIVWPQMIWDIYGNLKMFASMTSGFLFTMRIDDCLDGNDSIYILTYVDLKTTVSMTISISI